MLNGQKETWMVWNRSTFLNSHDLSDLLPRILAVFILVTFGQTLNAQSWTATGSMISDRADFTATLLPNGKVLVAGGDNEQPCVVRSSAELYDPTTGTFTATGSMITPRQSHTATLLLNGKVLVTGGNNCSDGDLASAELYDPTTGTFTATGSMANPRKTHTATLLGNGQVLIAGGAIGGYCQTPLSSAELYDPTTGSFTSTANMTAARFQAAATLLKSGAVLVAGGGTAACSTPQPGAELYDPVAGSFTATTGSMNSARYVFTATLLGNGNVLVAGGSNGPDAISSADLYDPDTDMFSATGSMVSARAGHTATLLSNGQVLVTGGGNNIVGALSSAELFDPVAGTFAATGSMNTSRTRHMAVLLSNGQVIVVGGFGNAGALTSAELYQPLQTPAQLITALGNTVNSFDLQRGIANSLDAKLQAAQVSLSANDFTSACNQINAFLNEVEAQSGKKITVAQANQLIAQVNAIRAALGCS